MSVSISRVTLRIAGSLACASALVALGGCHRSLTVREQAPARRADSGAVARAFPGVDVVRTARGGFHIRIISGLVDNGEPLYIIDGTMMTLEPSRGIDWLRLEDIAHLRVLKNPAERSVYGPRGVNGVIVITTKTAVTRRKPAPPAVNARAADHASTPASLTRSSEPRPAPI